MGKHSLGNSGSSLHNSQSTRTLHQQKSIGSHCSSRDGARLLLTGNSNKVPHYLRASTGSCHDMCKHGHHQDGAMKPLRETWPRSSLSSLNSIVTVVVSHKSRMEKVVKHEPHVASKKQSLVSSSKIKVSANEKGYSPRGTARNDDETLSLNSTRNMSSLLELPAYDDIVEGPSKGGCADDKLSSPMDKRAMDSCLLVSSPVGIEGKLQRNSSDLKTGRKITASNNRAAKKTLVHLSGPFSQTKTTPRKIRNFKLTSLKDSRRVHRIVKEAPENDDSDRTLHVIKTGPGNDAPADPNANANAIPALPHLSSSSSSSSSSASASPMSESSPDNTLHEISTRNMCHIQPVKHRHNRKSRKQGCVSENIPPPPLKQFRSQKSVLPQPDRSRSQRMRFVRTATILGAEKDKNDDGPDPRLPCVKVNLKHHEMQRKKETQGLFNTVIEETANKLVLSRKSKVKALVGAFEVVISLQEGKEPLHDIS